MGHVEHGLCADRGWLGDKVFGYLGPVVSIGHLFLWGRLAVYFEVCLVNCANVSLVVL